MTFHPRNSMSRSHVELRAEMNVLVILNTCQHPLDPNPKYEPKPVRLSIRKARPAGGTRSLPAFPSGKLRADSLSPKGTFV